MSGRAKKSPAKTSSRRALASSVTRESQLEPSENRLAVGYREGCGQKLHNSLTSLGKVQEVKSRRVFIIELTDTSHRESLMKKLEQWEDEELIEYVTPVLRDVDSQAIRILTDEITIRFKSEIPEKKLKTFTQKYGVTVARQNEFVPKQYILKVDKAEGLRTLEVAEQLDASDEVEFATPNYISEYQH